MKESVIFAKGKESKKILDGKERTTTPIAVAYYTYPESEDYSMGVGLAGYGTWGLSSPKEAITSWRAMKIAEAVTQFQDYYLGQYPNLSACYYAARSDEHLPDDEKRRVKIVVNQIGSETRYEVLNSVPENVEAMLGLLVEKGVVFSREEILDEVEQGRIEETQFITGIISGYRTQMQRLKDEEFGKSITLDDARGLISVVPPEGLGGVFLKAFDDIVTENKYSFRKLSDGIVAKDVDYIYGTHKKNPGVIVIVQGGPKNIIGSNVGELKIGMAYGDLGDGLKVPIMEKDYGAYIEPDVDEMCYLGKRGKPASEGIPNIYLEIEDKKLTPLMVQAYNHMFELMGLNSFPRKVARYRMLMKSGIWPF